MSTPTRLASPLIKAPGLQNNELALNEGVPRKRRIATKEQPASQPDENTKTLTIAQYAHESADEAMARAKLSPAIQGAVTALHFGAQSLPCLAAKNLDTNAVVAELKEHSKAVSANDLSRLEEMLTVQAHSLDAIFNECARRARLNIMENIEAFDRYMKVALRAQGQCRSAIEALSEMKNPRPFVSVGQANVANGPQQVNNGVQRPVRADAHARAGETSNRSNELLEQADGEWLDRRAASLAGKADSSMETVAQVHGADNGHRESEG
jgi:hypothetical protein